MSRRNNRKRYAVLLMALAMAVAAFAVYLATRFPGSSPRLLSEADDPALAAGEFLEALSAGDYEAAAGYLQGRPALGLDRLPDTEPERLLTEAFRESWQWTAGDIWHKDAEARLPVEFTALDITKLTAGLEEDVLDILALWLASAQRSSITRTTPGGRTWSSGPRWRRCKTVWPTRRSISPPPG